MRLRTRLMIEFDRFFIRRCKDVFKRVTPNPVSPIGYLIDMAAREAAEFMMSETQTAKIFTNHFELLQFALNNMPPDGLCLEFGVFKGESIDFIASKIHPRKVFGFDSFQGLRESWPGSPHDKGAFDLRGHLPHVPSNVVLVPGWFDQSLPAWMKDHKGPLAFIHIDSDTYEACKTIFESCHSRINSETIVIFDEHHGYAGWKHGEFKALNEYLEKYQLRRTYLAFSEMGAVITIQP